MKFNNVIESRESSSVSQSAINSRSEASTNATQAGPRAYSTMFEHIWQTHAKQILRITLRITNNREDAEDALQDSFLRAYVHLHSFDGRSSLSTWLTRIAINSALLIRRKRASANQISIDDDNGGSFDAKTSVMDRELDPEARYALAERRALVQSGLEQLRPSLRQAIKIQALEDHSAKETAEKMGISLSATKSRIFHAKAELRKSLSVSVATRRAIKRAQLSPA